MKKRLLALFCSLFAAVFLLSPFVFAAEEAEPPEVTGSAVVCNLESDKILFEQNLTGRIAPAPFTKLMTALLAMEYRESAGNVTVTVSEEMISSAAGNTMKLQVGEEIDFDSLLSALVVYNANDAALVLASVCGGNVASFVEWMNLRAEELGMKNTHYTNPTGIHSSAMYTTLEDTLILCKAVYRVNEFMLLSEQPQVTIPATNKSAQRQYTNRNALIPFSYITDYYMEGVRGMVAGNTGEAGFCVATTRQKNNATYLVVVAGGVDRSEKQNMLDVSSYRDAKALLEWAEEGFAFQTVLDRGKIICEKKVRLGAGVDHVILATSEEVKALLPVTLDIENEIRYEIHVEKDTFTAPVIEGSAYGTLDVIYKDEILATVPLVAEAGVGLSRWLVTWDAITGFFSHGPAKIALILVILAAVSYVAILVGTVWSHHAAENKTKRRLIAEMNEQENQRMKQVRLEEKKAFRGTVRRVTRAIHQGFLVLSGEGEDQGEEQGNPPRRGVARVPEKYRKHPSRPTPQSLSRPRRAANVPSGQKRIRPVVRSTPQKLSRPGNIGEGKKLPLRGEKLTLSQKNGSAVRKASHRKNQLPPRPTPPKKSGTSKNPRQNQK